MSWNANTDAVLRTDLGGRSADAYGAPSLLPCRLDTVEAQQTRRKSMTDEQTDLLKQLVSELKNLVAAQKETNAKLQLLAGFVQYLGQKK